MLKLFCKLTSGVQEIRKCPSMQEHDLNQSENSSNQWKIYPTWFKLVRNRGRSRQTPLTPLLIQLEREELLETLKLQSYKEQCKRMIRQAPPGAREMRLEFPSWSAVYSLYPWEAYGAELSQLPFKRSSGRSNLVRSPDSKLGLADITRNTSRVKAFCLQNAIIYSYFKDIRFVLVLCAMIGYSVWWVTAPEQLLHKPEALASPDLQLIINVVKDTYVNHVCSTHHLPSPCECGEPLNKTAISLLESKDDVFDPLDLNKRARALSVFFASILLSIALSESVSKYGVMM
jgi:hypothetical protein